MGGFEDLGEGDGGRGEGGVGEGLVGGEGLQAAQAAADVAEEGAGEGGEEEGEAGGWGRDCGKKVSSKDVEGRGLERKSGRGGKTYSLLGSRRRRGWGRVGGRGRRFGR